MSDLLKLRDALRRFAAEREWDQFHSPKNLAMALAVETAELMEPFQWLTGEESAALPADKRARVEEEMADVLSLRDSDARKQTGLKKAPRAAFGLKMVPKWRGHIDLARWMTRQLSKRFGRILLSHSVDFFRVSGLSINLNGQRFLVGISRHKAPGDTLIMWQIQINPAQFPVPSKRFPKDEQERYARDLLLISQEIHALLIRAPGVAGLRWFFEGWDVEKPGVRTPAELPWHGEGLEPTGAEHRERS